jgi:hypothetical protein
MAEKLAQRVPASANANGHEPDESKFDGDQGKV